ncbi:unnamed protein product [Urochloa humidicola]
MERTACGMGPAPHREVPQAASPLNCKANPWHSLAPWHRHDAVSSPVAVALYSGRQANTVHCWPQLVFGRPWGWLLQASPSGTLVSGDIVGLHGVAEARGAAKSFEM